MDRMSSSPSAPTIVAASLTLLVSLASSAGEPDALADASHFFVDEKLAAIANAAANGRIDELDVQLRQDVDLNAVGRDGMTVLTWTMAHHNKVGFQHLLAAGADPNLGSAENWSAIHSAAMIEDSEWLKMTLRYRGNPNSPDRIGRTPLFNAIGSFRRENARILVDHGAHIDHGDIGGITPWMYACIVNQYDFVLEMLKRGADYDRSDSSGSTIVDYLAEDGSMLNHGPTWDARTRVIEFLDARGVDVSRARAVVGMSN